MPARSRSQQRLFGMVHAYQKGKLKDAPEEVKNIARSISSEDAEHFAKTKHKGLPEKKAFFENKEKKNRFFGNLAVLSTAAAPFALSALFKGRGTKLLSKAEKTINSPTARKITLRDAAKAAYNEKLQWDKAGYKFKNMRIAEQNVPGFADLSQFEYAPVAREGSLRIGVKSLTDAHAHGINADMFFHELGHAHEFYKHYPKTFWGSLWRNYIGKNLMPVRWNPMYREEARAWANANKLSGGLIDKEIADAALNTYKNDIYRRNVVTLSGIGSAALMGNRFLGEKKAYELGFMDKLTEFGMLKSAGMAGMTKFKDIRRWVNVARKLRNSEANPEILRKQMREFVEKNVVPKLTIFRSKDPIRPGLPRMPPEVREIPASAKGFPRRPLYRGEMLPDYSTGGATSSGYVMNTGANIRHITPFADTAGHYGGGPILIYNAKRVPGVGNGRLRFVTNRGLAYITDNFKHPEKMFGQKDLQLGRERLKALDTRRNASWYARDVGLDYEAGIDVSKTLPSRVINAPSFGDAQDVTNLYEFARRQKQLLPENFDLRTLITGNKEGNLNPKRFNIAERDAILRPLTKRQRLAAERYQAIHDILLGLKDHSWHQ